MPENAPDQIAFLRLDTDYYSSTKVELETMFPRLSPVDSCARLMSKPGLAA